MSLQRSAVLRCCELRLRVSSAVGDANGCEGTTADGNVWVDDAFCPSEMDMNLAQYVSSRG